MNMQTLFVSNSR